eukprot:scaffold2798_cov87-Skeletonema_marinoi.AAC.2
MYFQVAEMHEEFISTNKSAPPNKNMTTSTESIASTATTQISLSEEAHWSSFRGEVLQLQQTLVASLFDNDNGCTSSSTKPVKKSRDKNTSRKGNDANYSSQADPTTKNNGKQLEAPANVNGTQLHHGVTKENKLPQSQLLQLSPLEELDDNSELINNESDDRKYNTTQSHHHYLELIGMEEVDRSICSVNNKHNLSSHDNNNVPANNNAMSHASQNTNALSIATQELAELKLKLALTESQKDELEFELMQSRHDSSDAA